MTRPGHRHRYSPATTIFVVTGVDKTLTRTDAFEGWVTHPDTQPEDINVGHVLARIGSHDRRWQAGRTTVDGVRWEERSWAQEDFIAFRDHVAALVEVRRRRPHRAAERLATCWIDIRTCRRQQEGEDPSSERYPPFLIVLSEGGLKGCILRHGRRRCRVSLRHGRQRHGLACGRGPRGPGETRWRRCCSVPDKRSPAPGFREHDAGRRVTGGLFSPAPASSMRRRRRPCRGRHWTWRHGCGVRRSAPWRRS